MDKEEVKAYYIEQLGKFFSKIADIPDEDLKGLPAVHIPSLGFTDEMPEVAFYGMETSGWFSMSELRKRFNNSPSIAYDYVTKDVFTPAFVISCAQPRKNIFWKYVVSLMSSMCGMTPRQLKTEGELKKHPLIWGNILALERYHVSAKHNGVKMETYNKVKAASAIFDTLPDGHWGPTYIVRACRPKLLFILYSKFEFENWLKNEFGIEKDKIFKPLKYAHIEETDTWVFQLPHPGFINRRGNWHKTITEVLERLALNREITV
jgi:hypothetical protein